MRCETQEGERVGATTFKNALDDRRGITIENSAPKIVKNCSIDRPNREGDVKRDGHNKGEFRGYMTPLAPLLSPIVSLYLILVAIAFLLSDAIGKPQIMPATALVAGGFGLMAVLVAIGRQYTVSYAPVFIDEL